MHYIDALDSSSCSRDISLSRSCCSRYNFFSFLGCCFCLSEADISFTITPLKVCTCQFAIGTSPKPWIYCIPSAMHVPSFDHSRPRYWWLMPFIALWHGWWSVTLWSRNSTVHIVQRPFVSHLFFRVHDEKMKIFLICRSIVSKSINCACPWAA